MQWRLVSKPKRILRTKGVVNSLVFKRDQNELQHLLDPGVLGESSPKGKSRAEARVQ